MKRFLLSVMMALFAFTSLTSTVEAKRMGSGGSYGRQAGRMATPPSAPMRQAPAPAAPVRQAQPAPASPAPAPQQAGSGMGGMVGGALLGLGVGSMLGQGANAANNAAGNEANATDNGSAAAANQAAADSVPAQGGSGTSLLTVFLLAAVAYFLYRRFRR